jgi:hypothetical protein
MTAVLLATIAACLFIPIAVLVCLALGIQPTDDIRSWRKKGPGK